MKRINKWTLLLTASYCILAVGCKDDERSYLVRETDVIQFSSNLASSQRITLRCNGAWRSIVPEDAQWLSTDSFGGRRYGRIRMDHRFVHAQPLGRTHSNALLGMQTAYNIRLR